MEFINPVVEVIAFACEDVICTSNNGGNNQGGIELPPDWVWLIINSIKNAVFLRLHFFCLTLLLLWYKLKKDSS